jgi:hypothetical protein
MHTEALTQGEGCRTRSKRTSLVHVADTWYSLFVAYFMTTQLGREVSLNDWLSFHRDRILSVLFQMRQQGVPRPGFQVSMIAGVTGLAEPQARELAESLAQAQLLVKDGGVYHLSEQGVRWVLESPMR